MKHLARRDPMTGSGSVPRPERTTFADAWWDWSDFSDGEIGAQVEVESTDRRARMPYFKNPYLRKKLRKVAGAIRKPLRGTAPRRPIALHVRACRARRGSDPWKTCGRT